jgi:hypothetical protein
VGELLASASGSPEPYQKTRTAHALSCVSNPSLFFLIFKAGDFEAKNNLFYSSIFYW